MNLKIFHGVISMNSSEDTFFVIVYIITIGVIPMFAGALKDYSANGIIRILARFAAPTISAVAITYVIFYYGLLSSFGIVPAENNSSELQEYVTIIPVAISFVVLLWLLFYKLVSFGENIGRREDTGLQKDGNKITNQVNTIITPTLDSFTEKIINNIANKLENFGTDLKDTVIPQMEKTTQNQQETQDKLDYFDEKEENRNQHQHKQTEKIDQLIEIQQKQNDILKTVQQWFAQNPNQYEILLSRTEALNTQNKKIISDSDDDVRNIPDDDISASDSNTGTILTTQDGIANRIIGHKKQEEMAQYLRDVGFEVTDGHGAGQPDFIIKKKRITCYDVDGTGEESTTEIIAVGSNKSFTLKDQPKRKQRRISADDCMPEIILAKKLHIPMIILVTNRNNGRRWAAKIPYEQLNDKWSGVTTPVILAQDDADSKQITEEEFLSVLASIGAKV